MDLRFDGPGLDFGTWSPHYLPAWSSRADSAASYRFDAGALVLDAVVRRCPSPPTYPMQLMLDVVDFPDWSVGDDDHLVPELRVWRVGD